MQTQQTTKPMELLKSMVFITWPVSDCMTMVHPTQQATYAGQLTFPFGDHKLTVVENLVELNIPVVTHKLAMFFHHWLVNTLKVAVDIDRVEVCAESGNGKDYQVWYTPNPAYKAPAQVLDDETKSVLDMHYFRSKLQAEYGEDGHPHYARIDWMQATAQGETELGYWEWVIHQLDAEDSEGAAA